MKKYILCLCMCLLLTACTNKPKPAPLSPSDPLKNSVIDATKKKITFTKPLTRIITTDSLATDLCLALGLKDQLVGLESVGDDECFYRMIDEDLCSLPRITSKGQLNEDQIIALNSDLVLLAKDNYDESLFKEKNVSTYVYEVRRFEDLVKMIKDIAKLTGKEDQAQSLLTYYDMQKERIKKFEKTASKVYFPSPEHYLASSTKDMFVTKMIIEAGGIPLDVESNHKDYKLLTSQKLVELNPEYIMIPADASYTKDDILHDESLQEIAAIKSNQVFEMPDAFEKWQEPVPSSILGMMWMSSILHQDEYPFEDLQKEVILFYQTFYDFTPSKTDITY